MIRCQRGRGVLSGPEDYFFILKHSQGQSNPLPKYARHSSGARLSGKVINTFHLIDGKLLRSTFKTNKGRHVFASILKAQIKKANKATDCSKSDQSVIFTMFPTKYFELGEEFFV